jgi:CDP-6-deoxy-D-xylo-4-hexulose-3-dehydrase
MVQKEVGQSSWFGFSFVLKPGAPVTRPQLVKHLQNAGAECRPIVTGNFAKNPVVKWFDYEIQGELPNANWIDQQGLFVGNHQVPITEALKKLRKTIDAI